MPSARALAMSGAPTANASLLLECQPELVTAVLKTDLAALEGATSKVAAEASTHQKISS